MTNPFEVITTKLESLDKSIQELNKQINKEKPILKDEYLTRSEVAKMFKVDISTIANWQKSNKLKPLGIGNRVYFLRSDIEQSLTPLNS